MLSIRSAYNAGALAGAVSGILMQATYLEGVTDLVVAVISLLIGGALGGFGGLVGWAVATRSASLRGESRELLIAMSSGAGVVLVFFALAPVLKHAG